MILTFLAVPIRSVLLYHASAKFNFSLTTVFLLHFCSRKSIHNRDYRIFRRALWTFWFILSFHLFEPEAFHLDLFVFEKKETNYCSYNEWWNPSIYPSRVVQLPKPYTYCKKNKKRDNKHKYFLSFIHTELLLLQDRVILHHNESNYK